MNRWDYQRKSLFHNEKSGSGISYVNLKSSIRRYWFLFFFLILLVLSAAYNVSFYDIWSTLSSLLVYEIFILLGFYFAISILNILSRKYLLYALSCDIGLKNLVLIHFSGIAAHYSTPAKLGFPVTVYLLNKLENIAYAKGTSIILIELIVSTGLCGIIAALGSYLYFADSLDIFILPFLLLSVTIVILYTGLHMLKTKKQQLGRFSALLENIQESFQSIRKTQLAIYASIRAIVQFVSAVNLVVLAQFVSSNISLWHAFIVESTAFFFGALSMVPLGLGVRDASALVYLQNFGIPAQVGISIVTVQRLISTGLSFLLGIFFSALAGLKTIYSVSANKS